MIILIEYTKVTRVLSLIGPALTELSIVPVFPGLVALMPDGEERQYAPGDNGYESGVARLVGAAMPAFAGKIGDAWGLGLIPWFYLLVAKLVFLLQKVLGRGSLKYGRSC